MIRNMLMAVAALFLAVPLAACDPSNLGSGPGTVSDKVVLDEQAALAVNLAYTAAAKGAALAIRTGVVKNPATIKRIGELDSKAYAAVQGVNAAYRTANASAYHKALVDARVAINAFNSAF